MNEERDKFLTEALGECWHELKYKGDSDWHCFTCDVWIYDYNSHTGHNEDEFLTHQNLDFSTWEGFGKLWTWGQEQEWWLLFIAPKLIVQQIHNSLLVNLNIISPDRFADAVYEFLKERESKSKLYTKKCEVWK